MINFINGETYKKYNNEEFTPIYMIKNGKQLFVTNLVQRADKNSDKFNESQIENIKRVKEQLIKNNGEYCLLYSKYHSVLADIFKLNPCNFIDVLINNECNIQLYSKLFSQNCNTEHWDFIGYVDNLTKRFHYRFYDKNEFRYFENYVYKKIGNLI